MNDMTEDAQFQDMGLFHETPEMYLISLTTTIPFCALQYLLICGIYLRTTQHLDQCLPEGLVEGLSLVQRPYQGQSDILRSI